MLVRVERNTQHGIARAADGRRVTGAVGGHMSQSAVPRIQKRQCLKEIGRLQPGQGLFLQRNRIRQAFRDHRPFFAKVKPLFLTCVDGGQQFKGIKFLAARVDLFEHKADSLPAGAAPEFDDRHLILMKGSQHLVEELEPELGLFRRVPPMADKPGLPVVPVEDPVCRKHPQIEFSGLRRQVPHDFLAEAAGLDTVLGHTNYGVKPIRGLVQRRSHIEVIEAFDLLLFAVHRVDDGLAHGRLIQRRDPLLAIKKQGFRHHLGTCIRRPSMVRGLKRTSPPVCSVMTAPTGNDRDIDERRLRRPSSSQTQPR